MITETLLYALPTTVEHNGLEFQLTFYCLPGPRGRLAYVGPRWENPFLDGMTCDYLYEVDQIESDSELIQATEEISGFLIINLPEIMAKHWGDLIDTIRNDVKFAANVIKGLKGGAAVHL